MEVSNWDMIDLFEGFAWEMICLVNNAAKMRYLWYFHHPGQMTIRFWHFLKILGKFLLSLSPILPANYVTCRTLVFAGAIRVRSMLITPLIRIRHELPIARGKLREELLDFRDERHFLVISP
jgi:hypothetical protein